MTNQIESAFGTAIEFPEDTSIGLANRTIKEKGAQGKDILTPTVAEFDAVITTINSLRPSQVDGRVTPHLRTTLEDLATLDVHLPTLKELRESKDPEVSERIDKVMMQVKKEMTKENGQWKWLNDLQTPRLITSSLFIDSYNEIMRQDPKFKIFGFDTDINVVGRTIEEASVLYHPEFGINRAASKFYTREEGFTQEFIDFSQAVRLIEVCRMLEPNILTRKNMDRVWKFIKENPYDVLELTRTLNQSVNELNLMAQEHDMPEMLKNIADSQTVISDHPLPLFLGETENGFNITNLHALYRALKTTNSHMKTGESVEKVGNLTKDVQENLAYARFHVDVSDPKAIFAGLITHMVEYWTKENPSYKLLGRDTMINALCEIIGYKHSDSDLFKLLYDKKGLDWYEADWGFDQKFIDSLEEKVKAREKHGARATA